jgi:curved DNA-binding protein
MTQAAGAMTAGQARELLGLGPGAGAEDLARAYRTAVKAVHPDLGGGDPERLRQVIEAHRLLKSLNHPRVAFTPAKADAPASQSLSVRLSLKEALLGGRRRLALPEGRTLEVRLPKGLRAGEALRLRRVASDGGDLLVHIIFLDRAGVTVKGDDLWLEVAAKGRVKPGARLEVDTPRGRRALTAPKDWSEGRPIRLKGQGLPARGRHKAGDLILKLKLEPAAAAAATKEPTSRKLLRRFSARWAA